MKILAFPRGLENPYQELLYESMRRKGNVIRYVWAPTPSGTFNMATVLPQLFFWRVCRYRVFHLHWANAFALRGGIYENKILKRIVYSHYVLCIKTIKWLGYRLVWTAHNALPHDPAFSDDVAARRILAKHTDLVIVHSQSTLDQLKALGVAVKKSVVIPHGSYIGVYPNTIDRAAAREKLGISNDKFVFLYFGQIRAYKGVDLLIEAYCSLSNESNQLLIAGKCSDEHLRALLAAYAQNKNILIRDTYIDDADIQVYFNAADVVVLPFREVSTSGSALLAFSFGKAVVVPTLGDLAYVPESVAYKYTQGKNALMDTLQQVQQAPDLLRKKSKAALEYARTLSWENIANKTQAAIHELFSSR
ncbi:MAG TPA: glycosyltransferase [Candidatus Paceibacterota bacterium]|nr:glycosyltransferase [Candidatus Paceibacterota bacterium]